jgi:hypothetical protein
VLIGGVRQPLVVSLLPLAKAENGALKTQRAGSPPGLKDSGRILSAAIVAGARRSARARLA